MSINPTIQITRFRMNSRSSIDNYSYIGNQHQQSGQKQPKSKKDFPLILKKMNSVEKYINQFKSSQIIQKQCRPKRDQSPLYDPVLSNSRHLRKIVQKNPDDKLMDDELKDLQQKCYIKYLSITSHDTEKKHSLLENAQTQYVKLKNSIHATGISDQSSNKLLTHTRTQSTNSNYQLSISPRALNQSSFVNPKSIYLLNKKKDKQKNGQSQSQKINHNDIQKQLKTSVIEEDGKKYFADLYLMKRERDKMFKEIFGTTEKNKSKEHSHIDNVKPIQNTSDKIIERNNSYRSNNTSLSIQKSMKGFAKKQSQKKFPKLKVNDTQLPSTTYEQKMKSQQKNFIQQKIIKDRSQKKQKMLKGRNMNWNVYYQMLALKKTEKDKLKGYCKFSQTYGED